MISLLCPTRGRPDNMRRFAESATTTATQPERVEIVWYVDKDDQPSIEMALHLHAEGLFMDALWGERIVLSEMWNRCAENSCGDIFGHMGDDVVFRTRGWDEQVRDAIDSRPDRIVFAHGRDGVHDERLGTHGFISWEWYEAVGYVTPPGFSHDYGDTWLNDVADRIGRRMFLPDVLTEHMHPDVGKSVYDRTYLDHVEAGLLDDVATLYTVRAPERERDAEKLRAVML